MKKYSSHKSIKPINTSINTLNTHNQNHNQNSNTNKLPISPTHTTSSYRKLTTIDLSNVKPV